MWLVDHGVHLDLDVVSVHATAEAAAECIRSRFSTPFEVDWDALSFSPAGDSAVLLGTVPPGLGFPYGYLAAVRLQRFDVDLYL